MTHVSHHVIRLWIHVLQDVIVHIVVALTVVLHIHHGHAIVHIIQDINVIVVGHNTQEHMELLT